MRLPCDTHNHSQFSFDTSDSTENSILRAIECGLEYICITEHMNVSPDIPHICRAFTREEYFAEIDRLSALYGDRITILRGIEYDNPQLYSAELEEFQHWGLDMIIGSVHRALGYFPADPQLLDHYSPEEIERDYCRACIECAKVEGYDTFGHFGLPHKMLRELTPDLPERMEALEAIARSGHALEINTCGVRNGYAETMPSRADLHAFADMGGERITLGSDGHGAAQLTAGYDLLHNFHEPRLTLGIFVKREWVPLCDCG